MSEQAAAFVKLWIGANIPETVIDEKHETNPKEYAQECRKHAAAAGISTGEIEESCGDLEDVMADAIDYVTQQARRLAEKDK